MRSKSNKISMIGGYWKRVDDSPLFAVFFVLQELVVLQVAEQRGQPLVTLVYAVAVFVGDLAGVSQDFDHDVDDQRVVCFPFDDCVTRRYGCSAPWPAR